MKRPNKHPTTITSNLTKVFISLNKKAALVHQIIYCSIPAQNLTMDMVHQIINTSREYNRQKDISGFLMFDNKLFIQYLEGPEDNVKHLIEKIKKDPRHENFHEISSTTSNNRQFEKWDLAFIPIPSIKIFDGIDELKTNKSDKSATIKALIEGIHSQLL